MSQSRFRANHDAIFLARAYDWLISFHIAVSSRFTSFRKASLPAPHFRALGNNENERWAPVTGLERRTFPSVASSTLSEPRKRSLTSQK